VHNADNLPPSCVFVTKSGHLNSLEPSGPLRASNGTALSFYRSFHLTSLNSVSLHCTFRRFSPHFYSFHFTPFIVAFPNLFIPNESCCSYFAPLSLDVTNFKMATTKKIIYSVFDEYRDKNSRSMCILHAIVHKTTTEC